MENENEEREPGKDADVSNRRVDRRRMAVVALVLYVAVIIVIGASFVAYPEFFNNSEFRYNVIKSNYQILVFTSTLLSGLITIAIVSPRVLTAFADIVLPSRGMKDAVEAIILSIAGLKPGSSDRGAESDSVDVQRQSDLERLLSQERPIFRKIDEISADDLVANFIVRMREEQKRLKGNALSNLAWGVMFAICGLAVLSYPVLFPSTVPVGGWATFSIGYIPRAALATMIALISFFFLRLYASNEYDLKHTKNEISTFESKIIAAKLAVEDSVGGTLSVVLAALAANERNFVLKSGEKTISTEVDTKYNEVLVVVRDLVAVLQKTESKN